MKTPEDFSIHLAYSYDKPEDLARYYNDSAKEYDDYVRSVGYILPRLVAEKAIGLIRESDVVIDVGCGTGLLGVELNLLNCNLQIHGFDVSPMMILCAYEKRNIDQRRCYEKLHQIDATTENPISKNKYSFMVSSGTFTTGHLDGNHLSRIVNLMKNNSFAVFSVKSDHYYESNFMDSIKGLEKNKSIELIDILEVDSYENPRYTALSQIVSIKIT
jgi:predicted TPR repeat methyltransferase